jgi:hypothetical protein
MLILRYFQRKIRHRTNYCAQITQTRDIFISQENFGCFSYNLCNFVTQQGLFSYLNLSFDRFYIK